MLIVLQATTSLQLVQHAFLAQLAQSLQQSMQLARAPTVLTANMPQQQALPAMTAQQVLMAQVKYAPALRAL
jgi:hypothetical protein